MAISTRFGQSPEAKYYGASLRTLGADTRGGITPGVRADLDALMDIASAGKAGSPARMLLQVHDELVFECPAKEAPAAIEVISAVMRDAPEPAVALSVPLVVDARAGANWDEAH